MVIVNDARVQTAPESATMVNSSANHPSGSNGVAQAVPKAREWLEGVLEKAARAVQQRYLERLSAGKVKESIRTVPDRIQRTAQQLRAYCRFKGYPEDQYFAAA
jgi:hypothetical protein